MNFRQSRFFHVVFSVRLKTREFIYLRHLSKFPENKIKATLTDRGFSEEKNPALARLREAELILKKKIKTM